MSAAAFGEGVNPICTHVVLRGSAPSVHRTEGKRARVRLEVLPSWFCASEFVRQLVVLDLTGNRLTTLPHATGKLRCVRYRLDGGGNRVSGDVDHSDNGSDGDGDGDSDDFY